MSHNYLISLFLLCCISYAHSQSSDLDSLLQLATSLPEDTNKIHLLNELSTKFRGTDLDKSKALAEQALQLSERLNFPQGMIDAHYMFGVAILFQGDAQTALERGTSSLKIAKEQNALGEQSRANSLLGVVHQELGNINTAIEHILEAAQLAEQANDDRRSATAYIELGNLWFLNSSNLEKAKEYYLLGKEKAEKINNTHLKASAYFSLGSVAHQENKTAEAIEYYEETMKLYEEMGSQRGIEVLNNNLIALYHDAGRHTEAIELAYEILYKSTVQNNKTEVIAILSTLAKSYKELTQIDSAIYYFNEVVDLARIPNDCDLLAESHKQLATIFKDRGNLAQALKHSNEAFLATQEMYNDLENNQLVDATTRYETHKKEAEIAQQKLKIAQEVNNRNQIIIFGGLAFVAALFLFQWIFYRHKRKSQAALIAEQKEAEKLRELDHLKSSFFANISHELRTPLTLVAAPLNDAIDQVKPSPLKNHLQLAHSNTQKLLRLVNEILDLSKLDAGKVETKLKEVDLLPLIRRLFYAFESIAQIRNLQLQFNTNIPKDLKVQLDSEKFEKIINNLLSNAVKFTENGGKITLNAHQDGEQFSFEVIDTGMGISQEELPLVFNRFYQSTSEEAPLQGGTGIGLSLAKELAHVMNGELKVESEIGVGSRFVLSLPLKSNNPKQTSKTRHETIALDKEGEDIVPTYAPILLKGQKPKILIIEDNQEMSDYLVQSLSSQYHCTQAYDGLEALHFLENESVDLITCDVMMPNMDGFTLRQRVLQSPSMRSTPFVMLTARSMEEDKLKGLRMGVDDYLTKPFNLNELKARLHNLLSNKISREHFEEESVQKDVKSLTLEEQLLQKAEEYVLQRIDDPQLRIEDMAKNLQLSQRHLSRMLNKYVGMSPVAFILELRLQKARSLLESRQFASVSEVRYEIGIESASYFTRKFTERFGKTPKEYLD